MKLNPLTLKKVRTHARELFPRESCGIIVEDDYLPMNNLHPFPEKAFRMDESVFLQYPKLQSIIHSHPNGPEWPTKTDMACQRETAVPWGILPLDDTRFGEFFWVGNDEIPPLLKRPFRHGVTDCYALMRDWYILHRGIICEDVPRDWEWWNKGDNFYEDHFASLGFVTIDKRDVKEGDVFFACLRSKIVNHAGIYAGRGLIFHHVSSRLGYDPSCLSGEAPLGIWQRFIKKWIRYDPSIPTRKTVQVRPRS